MIKNIIWSTFCFLLVFFGLFFIKTYIQSFQKEEVVKFLGFHDAMYMGTNSDFFEKTVESFKNQKPLQNPPRIFITNQHVLAGHMIAEQFALASDPETERVIIITQNNWNEGKDFVVSSKFGWKTQFGEIYPDLAFIKKLEDKKLISIEEGVFKKEHGITGIVPFVSKYFPNAKIVPIVLMDQTPNKTLDTLSKELSDFSLEKTVIIGTIDASHYLPKYISDVHDEITINTIKNFDYNFLPKLDIDTVPTLRAILKTAENNKMNKFVLTRRANSADITHKEELVSTTGYFTGYFEKGKIEKESKINLLFTGDIMLDRSVRLNVQNIGYDALLENVERLFLGNHLNIGNLEGTITDNPSLTITKVPVLKFTFDPAVTQFLTKYKFDLLSLANNHSLDFEQIGFEKTKDYLLKANLDFWGSALNNENLTKVYTFDDKNICLVAYHDLFTKNQKPITEEIKKIEENCFQTIAYVHWGEEYGSKENSRQTMLAHEFIDNGADLIVGSHPHVVLPIEIYKDKAIVYSLGNFIFDQGFSFETEHGVALDVMISEEKIDLIFIPVEIKMGVVKIVSGDVAQKVLSRLKSTNLTEDQNIEILKNNKITIWSQKSKI